MQGMISQKTSGGLAKLASIVGSLDHVRSVIDEKLLKNFSSLPAYVFVDMMHGKYEKETRKR